MEPVSETTLATIGFSLKFSIFYIPGWLMKLSTALATGVQSPNGQRADTQHTNDLAVTS
jgi:hypothetical protein